MLHKKQVSHQRMGSFISPLDRTQDKSFPDRETLKRVLSKAWPRVSAVGWTRSPATKNLPQSPCVLIQLTPQCRTETLFHLLGN